jgi:hypothetical protein
MTLRILWQEERKAKHLDWYTRKFAPETVNRLGLHKQVFSGPVHPANRYIACEQHDEWQQHRLETRGALGNGALFCGSVQNVAVSRNLTPLADPKVFSPQLARSDILAVSLTLPTYMMLMLRVSTEQVVDTTKVLDMDHLAKSVHVFERAAPGLCEAAELVYAEWDGACGHTFPRSTASSHDPLVHAHDIHDVAWQNEKALNSLWGTFSRQGCKKSPCHWPPQTPTRPEHGSFLQVSCL